MHPYIVIFHMGRLSDGIYTIPDVPNTLTRQFAGTNNDPRDLLYGPVICNPSQIRPRATSMSTFLVSPSILRTLQEFRLLIKSYNVSDASAIIGIVSSTLATISDWTRIAVSDLILLAVLDWIKISYFLFNLTHA